MRSYQQVQRRFEAAGGYGYRDRLSGVVEGLGLPDAMLERGLLSLSGGELTRVTLARALLADADLLLLDEPTNHLDIDSVEWLEAFLSDYERAFLLVTHDRRLLEKVGRRVLAVEHEHVETQGGDFATYLRESEARLDLMRREYEQDLEKIEQLQRFYDRFHAKKDKAKQAKAKLTQIERIKAGLRAPPKQKRSFKLGLPQPKPSARVVLELKTPAVTVGSADDSAGAHTLIRDVDVVLERGEKVALLGPNGSGKTTLIETVAGLRSLAAGASHLGHNVRPAYYSQQGRELREEDTVLQSVLPLVGQEEQAARGLLGRFQFGPDEVEKRVEMLSGGERSRLRLLTLLVGDANFLLLDEPTNHLDMGSVEALADALEDYTGTILLVTHDRHLIDRVATRVLEIHDGRLLNHLSAATVLGGAQRAPGHHAGARGTPASRRQARRQVRALRRSRHPRQGERRGGAPSARPSARGRGGHPAELRGDSARSTRSSQSLRPTPTGTSSTACSTNAVSSRASCSTSTRPGRSWSTRRRDPAGRASARHGGSSPVVNPRARVWYARGDAPPPPRQMTRATASHLPSARRTRRAPDAAADLVRGEPARSALAPDRRPLRHPRQRDHAPADAGAAGGAAVRRVAGRPGPTSRAWRRRRSPTCCGAGRASATTTGPDGCRSAQRRRSPPAPAGRRAELPRTLEGLRALPGIGPYTARAVLVFAHNDDLAAVDANVRRVLTHQLEPARGPRATRSFRRSPTPCSRAAAAATGTTP